ncbi:tryptophan-rich sensory protein TspO [Algirhabdus cladophorae]|uniref:tryptophan-rich sensory protein TspO n=1 Tax=Algirhabdus cladophorae TaxID=3377108 RepID=UPI003B84546A
MDWFVFALFMAASFTAAATGSLFPPDQWYKDLTKPGWTPPNWLFPIAWTILYVASAYAAMHIALHENNAVPMGFWAFQIAANTLWTPIFFGLKKLGVAMVAILVLWIAVLGTLITFFQLDQVAGLLMVPYLIWVSYAAALNLNIWRTN